MSDAKRLAFFLPNTFTALNMACGHFSILLSLKGEFYLASIILLVGAIFDAVDGRIARLTGTESPFGEQFDSMSDVISFGVAPSLLVYLRFFGDFGRPGMVIAFVFLLCGALRLARFNANIEKVDSSFFQGLPIPGAAIGLIGFVLFQTKFALFQEVITFPAVYVLFYAFLMISNIPFYSFKNSKWVKKHKKMALLIIFLLMALVFIYEEIMVFALISVYVIGCLIYFFIHRKGKLEDIFTWKNENENEKET